MIALLVLLSCRDDAGCSTSRDCALGESCDAGTCVPRTCASSDQCAPERFCDAGGQCREGCAADTDCLAGRACVDGACEDEACADTRLDCGFREFCVDGACEDAGDPYCAPCATDAECGEGNVCWAGEWCGVDCSQGQACPSGFDCLEVSPGGPRLCLGACWLPPPEV